MEIEVLLLTRPHKRNKRGPIEPFFTKYTPSTAQTYQKANGLCLALSERQWTDNVPGYEYAQHTEYILSIPLGIHSPRLANELLKTKRVPVITLANITLATCSNSSKTRAHKLKSTFNNDIDLQEFDCPSVPIPDERQV